MQVFLKHLVLGLASVLPSLALSATDLADAPAFIADTQYSAVFEQERGSWLLVPPAGGVLTHQGVGHCRDDQAIAPGLWLVTRDAVGLVELVAPSVTPLPAGHPDRIALLACDSSEAYGLHLPRALIEQLARDHGVVRVQ